MYQNRFQNKKVRRLINIKNYFSLNYMGKGTFYYSLPNLKKPIVKKIEFGLRSYRRRFFLSLCFSLSFLSIVGFFPNSQNIETSESEENLQQLEKKGLLDELEEKSNQAKSKLYKLKAPISSLKSAGVTVKKYKVQDGDTLSEIAIRYSVPATIIAATSNIKFHSVLRPGQELSIPNRPGLIYQMKKGDTLAAVMNKYSVKLKDVISDNPNLEDSDLIEIGTEIFLPNAKIQRPALKWGRPVYGRFSSRFGWRRHPILRRRHFHTGIDIAVSYKAIRSARKGRVVYAGYLGSYGKVVVVRHDSVYKTLYAHLSRIKVRSGRYINKGKVIGISGNTGRSTGPHLHFEVIKNGRPVNPRRYIRF